MEKSDVEKAEVILNFFRDAFCADEAQFATDDEAMNLKPLRPIKLITSDGRGEFFICYMIGPNTN